jgi:glutamate---methylamine ligase
MPDLTRWASEAGISHFLVGFTDLLGAQRSKLIHASLIGDALRDGVRFAGYAVSYDLSPEDPDLVAILEPESVVQLPWRPDVAWMLAAPQLRGEPLAQDPRHHLRRIAGRAAADGLSLRTGVECEFFLLAEGDLAAKPPQERHAGNSYRQDLLLRRHDVLAALSNAMAAMGWGPEQVSQEDAEGQFEITWGYDDAVTTADRHAFFRMMLRDIAGRHGLAATFMPKPFADRTGSGCHVHMSLWRNGENLFLAQDPTVGLSPTGMRFVGGLVHSAAAMAAFTNPVVNSYKRLDASRSAAVSAWLSGAVSHATERRTQLIRLLGGARCEFRLPDSAANPYLLQAAILAAGLDGIAQARDPGPPDAGLDGAMSGRPGASPELKQLPTNLLDALRTLKHSDVMAAAFTELLPAYLRLKTEEWHAYCRHLSQWEINTTFDC